MRAAKVSVFFVDENQIISPEEVGEPGLIRETAWRLGTNFKEFHLVSQFRCNGSNTYLTWLDDQMLGLGDSAQGLRLTVPTGFDFEVIRSPQELLEEVREKNRASGNSARLLAGWCWPWSDPLPDRLVEDVVIGDFRFAWESKSHKKPPPGVPEARYSGNRSRGCKPGWHSLQRAGL